MSYNQERRQLLAAGLKAARRKTGMSASQAASLIELKGLACTRGTLLAWEAWGGRHLARAVRQRSQRARGGLWLQGGGIFPDSTTLGSVSADAGMAALPFEADRRRRTEMRRLAVSQRR